MASVTEKTENNWLIDLGGRDDIIFEVRMSHDVAKRLLKRETMRIKRLNPGLNSMPTFNYGVAVLNILSVYAANGEL